MAENEKPKILIALRENGQNGGPYVSHKRIMEDPYLNERYSFEVLWFPRARRFLNPFFFFRYVKTIKRAHPALVQIAGLQLEGFFPILACRFARVKTVLAVHGSTAEALNVGRVRKFFVGLLEKCSLRRATAAYGVSDYVSGWKICRKNKRFFGTIYNLPGEFRETDEPSTIRKELGIAPNDVVIVSTGRIIRDKGFDTLCEIAKRFRDRPDVKFVVAGDGAYREEFASEIAKTEQEKQVFLLGYRSDVDNLLKSSDLFLICTRHETLCISVLEASRAGLPVVASKVGGIPEIVGDGSGFLVSPDDTDGFVSALEKLIESPDLRSEMGENGKRIVADKFDAAKTERKLDDLYRSVINGRKR